MHVLECDMNQMIRPSILTINEKEIQSKQKLIFSFVIVIVSGLLSSINKLIQSPRTIRLVVIRNETTHD